jgi:hypothetical protein
VGLFRKQQPPSVDQALADLLIGESDDIRANRQLELRHLAFWQPHILAIIETFQEEEEPEFLSVEYGLSLAGMVYEDVRVGVLLVTGRQSIQFNEWDSGPGSFEIQHADLTTVGYRRDPGPAAARVTRVRLDGKEGRCISHAVLSTSSANSICGVIRRLHENTLGP